MKQLQDIAKERPLWSLEEFVREANRLLPEILPDERANTRVREEVTPRLVRHYTTQGMLDEPLKQGREARYQYRHLLQVLLLRRLLAAGYGAGAIAQFVVAHSNDELETLLQGEVWLTISATPPTPNNSALEFLQQIQTSSTPMAIPAPPKMQLSRTSIPVQSGSAHSASIQPSEAGRSRSAALARSSPRHLPPSSQWKRIEIAAGLEIHIGDRFSLPTDPVARQKLLEAIAQALQI
jgi:DNA-binding transcriptional MerR regulator